MQWGEERSLYRLHLKLGFTISTKFVSIETKSKRYKLLKDSFKSCLHKKISCSSEIRVFCEKGDRESKHSPIKSIH